jgi:hypothetical protein
MKPTRLHGAITMLGGGGGKVLNYTPFNDSYLLLLARRMAKKYIKDKEVT